MAGTAIVEWKPSLLSSVYDAEATASITFGGQAQAVTFRLAQGGSGTGATQWPSGRDLAELIAQDPSLASLRSLGPALDAIIAPSGEAPFDSRVVELGSGLGLVGAVAVRVGAQVIATDGVEDLIEQLQQNLDLNRGEVSADLPASATASVRALAGGGSAQAMLLPWGDMQAIAAVKRRLCELRRPPTSGGQHVGSDDATEPEPEPEAESAPEPEPSSAMSDDQPPRVPTRRPVRRPDGGRLGNFNRATLGAPTSNSRRSTGSSAATVASTEQRDALWTFQRAPGYACPEVLLVADCVFGSDRGVHQQLLCTIEALCNGQTLLLLVQKPRYPTERRFFRKLTEGFDGWVVPLPVPLPVPSQQPAAAKGGNTSTVCGARSLQSLHPPASTAAVGGGDGDGWGVHEEGGLAPGGCEAMAAANVRQWWSEEIHHTLRATFASPHPTGATEAAAGASGTWATSQLWVMRRKKVDDVAELAASPLPYYSQ